MPDHPTPELPRATDAPRTAPPSEDRLPPYRVLLHNDDRNEMDYVVLAIEQLVCMPRLRAMTVMMAAHTTGLALVTVTHKERAELYVDQFRSKGMRVTIEPDE